MLELLQETPPPLRFEDAPFVTVDGRYYRNLFGLRVGRLTVVRRTLRPGTTDHWWVCRCDCGHFTYATVASLRLAHKTSCGCARGGAHPHNYSAHHDEVIRRFTDPDRPQGQSIGQLALEIGITKNAAIGILNRAGLVGEPPAPRPVMDFPARGSCLYMFGVFGTFEFRWCGIACKEGSSYCPVHHPLIWVAA